MEKEWFKMVRNYLGLTCDDIAKLMGCTKQTISNVETGKDEYRRTKNQYETILRILLNERGIEDIIVKKL